MAEDQSATIDRLEREARLLSAIASATPDLLSIFDLSGRVLYANAALLKLWGRRSVDEVLGLTMRDLGLPEGHVATRERDFARIAITGQAETTEVPWNSGPTPSIFYETTLTPVFGADGTVEAIAGTTRDITERRRREDRDALLVRLDDEARHLIDADTIARATARALGEHLGADRCAYADVEADQDTFNLTGDYCRAGVESIVGRYAFNEFDEECLRLMRAGKPYAVNDIALEPPTPGKIETYRDAAIRAVICVPLTKDGNFVAALGVHQSTPRAWRDDEVELVQMVASRCWESIERARITRQLSDSEQRLRLALHTGKLGVWEVDLRTLHMSCSDTCKLNYGAPVDQPFTYEQLWAAMHPDDVARVRDSLQRAIEQHGEYSVEYRVEHRVPLGRVTRWVSVRGRASYAGDAQVPTRMVGVSLDITAQKSEEERRGRLLEAEKAARVAAEGASHLKDEFLATLSHELRTPLSAILGWAQILRRTPQTSQSPPLPAAFAEGLAAIERNARAQTQIIEDLLDMSRIVSGKVSLDTRPIDLSTVVAAAMETVQPASAAKEVAIRIEQPREPMIVLGDPNRLQQVFWNLLTNAVKFTPRGGNIIVRSTFDASQPGRLWRVDVIDSGEGIAADFLPHVFDRFRQADAGTTRRHGGLGLGLSIVKQLAEVHGGTVGVASDGPGRGATFTVWLPVVSLDYQRATGTAAPSDSLEAATVARQQTRLWDDPRCEDLAGIRVLIVDDEPDARTMLRRVLESCDAVVFDAADAADALALLRRESIDILVSDIGMPLTDGHELMRSVRATPGASAVPAVALTAYARAEDRAKALAAGFDLHLAKPVEPGRLLEAVVSLIGRKPTSIPSP